MCVPNAIFHRSGIEQAKQLEIRKQKVAIVSPSISVIRRY
jgi:hypothetical protein